MYDFNRCKLCTKPDARPKYRLKETTIYECCHCGFHFIDYLDPLPPQKSAEEVQKLDRRAMDYIETRLVANSKQLHRHLRLVEDHCSLAAARCLDLGAGVGLFSSLQSAAGAEIHGIEPQQIFRDFSLHKFNISLRAETIEDEYWQDRLSDYFDIVTLWDVLEHVNFPAETLRHAFAVTKPGGWLFLDTPRRDALAYRLSQWSYRLSLGSNPLLLNSLYSSQPFRHKQIFTRHQLRQLVKEIGYAVVELRSSSFTLQNKMTLVCRKP